MTRSSSFLTHALADLKPQVDIPHMGFNKAPRCFPDGLFFLRFAQVTSERSWSPGPVSLTTGSMLDDPDPLFGLVLGPCRNAFIVGMIGVLLSSIKPCQRCCRCCRCFVRCEACPVAWLVAGANPD